MYGIGRAWEKGVKENGILERAEGEAHQVPRKKGTSTSHGRSLFFPVRFISFVSLLQDARYMFNSNACSIAIVTKPAILYFVQYSVIPSSA